jgi:hypothetical protein
MTDPPQPQLIRYVTGRVSPGDGWRLGVDLAGEQGEGSCDAGFGGWLEFNGDRFGRVGDGSGEAADDGFRVRARYSSSSRR